MPLILVTGLPSSGKSKLSQDILNHFQKLDGKQPHRKVRIVSDSDYLDWEGRNSIYISIAKEKELRGWLRAEAQRYVNLNQIVILDAAAYIKGFRYELYCMCKEAKTQHCVVELFIDPEICWKRNETFLTELAQSGDSTNDLESPKPGYDRETFDALVLRYEKCDEQNRWDSPLFRLLPDDELDMEEVYNVITKGEPLSSNKCTSLSSTSTTIFKHKK